MDDDELYSNQIDELNLFDDLKDMVKAYPNDTELGAEIRKIYGD